MRRAAQILQKLASERDYLDHDLWPTIEERADRILLEYGDPIDVAAGLQETLSLGARRGEVFDAPDISARAVWRVDGLRALFLEGAITRTDRCAADRYREEYCLAFDVRTTPEDPEELLENTIDAILVIERTRKIGLRSDPSLIRICDLVCGQGRWIQESDERGMALLLAALDSLNAYYDSLPADFIEHECGHRDRFRKPRVDLHNRSAAARVKK